MLLKFRAAMFDMDGTILYTMRYWRLTTIEFLLSMDIYPTPEQMSRIFCSSSRGMCKEAMREHGIYMEDMEILRGLESYMHLHYQRDAKPKERADEYLDQLGRAGIPMCIATAAPREFAGEALERLGLAHHFSFITDCYEQEMLKNNPEFFRRMAAKLGVGVQDMCVFEDSLYSIKTAKEAGCPVIAIWDKTQEHDWVEITRTADFSIRSYDELIGK